MHEPAGVVEDTPYSVVTTEYPPPGNENCQRVQIRGSKNTPHPENEKVPELDGDFRADESMNTPAPPMKKCQKWMETSKLKSSRISPPPQ